MAISYINSGTAEATTITIPSGHQAGDLLIIFAFRDGSGISPSLPSGWDSIALDSGTSCSNIIGSKIALSGSETSGTWTNATELICHVYRNQATHRTATSTPNAARNGTGLAIDYGAAGINAKGGWSVWFSGHSSTDVSLGSAPTGTTNRAILNGATATVASFDTNGSSPITTLNTVNITGTSGNWLTKSFSIYPTEITLENYKSFDVGDGMSASERIR